MIVGNIGKKYLMSEPERGSQMSDAGVDGYDEIER